MLTSLWLGRAKLCSSASGCELGYNCPTRVHSGAQAEGAIAPQCGHLPAAHRNAWGQAWRCKCILSLCLHHITNIPLSKAENIAKPQVKKSGTRDEFGPISQSMMYCFKFSFVEKSMVRKKKKNQNQHYFPIRWEKQYLIIQNQWLRWGRSDMFVIQSHLK